MSQVEEESSDEREEIERIVLVRYTPLILLYSLSINQLLSF